MMALRKEPHRRYASVSDLAADILKHLEGLPITARPSTLAYRGTKFVRRHRELAVGAACLSCAAWRPWRLSGGLGSQQTQGRGRSVTLFADSSPRMRPAIRYIRSNFPRWQVPGLQRHSVEDVLAPDRRWGASPTPLLRLFSPGLVPGWKPSTGKGPRSAFRALENVHSGRCLAKTSRQACVGLRSSLTRWIAHRLSEGLLK